MRNLGKTGRRRRQQRQSVQQKSPVDHNIIELTMWMKRKGFKNNLLQPYDFEDIGRGLRCRKKIQVGDCIISIPRDLLITTRSVLDSDLGSVIKRYHHILKPRQLLCVFLIYEKHRGKQSDWYFYIKTLPESYTNMVNWTKEDISWLPSDLQSQATLLLEEIERSYIGIYSLVSDIEHQYPELLGFMNYSRYVWAWSAVNTRCMYMKQPTSEYISTEEEDHYALAPYLDLLNHSSNAQVRAGYNERTKCFEIHTDTPYKRWNQAFISYGPHDNCKLLLEYGFILPQNPQNAVSIRRDDLDKLMKIYKFPFFPEKVLLFEEQGILRGMSINNSGFSWALNTAVAILISQNHKKCVWLDYITGVREANSNEKEFVNVARALINRKSQEFKIKTNPRNIHQHLASTLQEQLLHLLHQSRDEFNVIL